MVEIINLIKISPQDIADTLQLLSSYLKRDRNYICYALSLINQNILDWDAEINEFIHAQMAKELAKPVGEKMTEENIHEIFRNTLEYPRSNPAAQSVLILQNIENQYRELGLANILDIQKIKEIRYLISGEESSGVPGRDWINDYASNPEQE